MINLAKNKNLRAKLKQIVIIDTQNKNSLYNKFY